MAKSVKKSTEHWSVGLPKSACAEALAWARTQPTAKAAWLACQRGDWMLLLLGWLSGAPETTARKSLVLCACDCAELARPYWRAEDDRPAKALRIARAWARDEGPTIQDMRDAADAASSAAYAAAAASSAAYAANSAAWTALAAAAVRSSVLAQCADIVRRYYPKAPKL